MCSILLLPLVARWETIEVCIWRMFVVVTVWGGGGGRWQVCCVAAVVKDSRFIYPWLNGIRMLLFVK